MALKEIYHISFCTLDNVERFSVDEFFWHANDSDALSDVRQDEGGVVVGLTS